MELKKEIEKLLELLSHSGFDRSKIEKELAYSENYIDQALSRGGNTKLLSRLKVLEKSLLRNTISDPGAQYTKKPPLPGAYFEDLENRVQVLESNFAAVIKRLREIESMNNSGHSVKLDMSE